MTGMERLKGLMTSERSDWETPPEIFGPVQKEFKLELDVCATKKNALLPEFFTPEQDGLSKDWAPKKCWMNPPYGKQISRWVKKAYEESLKGALVVCLVPARTDTAWWHDYCAKGEVRFYRGRIKFLIAGERKKGFCAPFPSALVLFHPIKVS